MRPIILGFLLLVSSGGHAISNKDIVIGLEALGDLEAAWPLALNLAQQQNDYSSWRKLAEKYQPYDSGDQAYVAAWNAARAVGTEMVYQDFLTLRQPSPQSMRTADRSASCAANGTHKWHAD